MLLPTSIGKANYVLLSFRGKNSIDHLSTILIDSAIHAVGSNLDSHGGENS